MRLFLYFWLGFKTKLLKGQVTSGSELYLFITRAYCSASWMGSRQERKQTRVSPRSPQSVSSKSTKAVDFSSERKRLRAFSKFQRVRDILVALTFLLEPMETINEFLLIQYFVVKSFIQPQQGHKAFGAGKLFTINLGMPLLNLPTWRFAFICK